jgi:ABC-type dipeptide/oligopeptide/nickel transport system permease subunit
MSHKQIIPAISSVSDLAPEVGYWVDVRRRFLRNRLAVIGLSIIALLFVIALFGPLVFRGNFTEAVPGEQFKRIGSPGHILGTDDVGRDMLRRTVRGIGISFRLAIAVTVSITLIGMVLGGLAGYLGGWVDSLISRLIDGIYAIPYVIVGIAMIAVFGPKVPKFLVVMTTLVLTTWVGTARLFRAAVLQIRNQDFVEAAKATGADTKRILLSHILPNALPPIIVSVAFAIAGVVLSESIYSFLGIGFIEPTPALGVMIASAKGLFTDHPHLLFVPASVLVMLTLSVVFVGDGLRDALDPKLRGAD